MERNAHAPNCAFGYRSGDGGAPKLIGDATVKDTPMNANLSLLLVCGLLAVAGATTMLVLLVGRDLAPVRAPGAPRGHGRWFLGAALGIGIIAFTLKLGVILVLSSYPGRTIAPLIATAARAPAGGDDPAAPEPRPARFLPLPAVAPAPADNPSTPAKVALGERLFHDTALSRDHTVACASCHDVDHGAGAETRPTSVGIGGAVGRRNAPSVFNAAFQARLFWDGRAASLEDQAMGPPFNPDEMGMPSAAAIEERIGADPSYPAHFVQAFGPGATVTMGRITQAIAAYERSLIAADTAYDRFVRGDQTALTAAQRRGLWLFQTVGCVTCHGGPNFSGASLVGPRAPFAPFMAARSAEARQLGLDQDKGRAAPGATAGVWRVPSLRNVALTAPYFHNGAVAELDRAVRIMATAQLNALVTDDDGARRQPRWSAERQSFDTVTRLVLTGQDIADLVAFLHALSDDALARRAARP